MGVRVDRDQVTDGPCGIRDRLLCDQHERRLGHHPADRRAFGRSDRGEGATQVDRPGPPDGGTGPRDAVADCEVHLERGGSVTEPAVGPGPTSRKPGTEDRCSGPRSGVEQERPVRRQVLGGFDTMSGDDGSAVGDQQRDERCCDRAGPALGHGPTAGVAGGDEHGPGRGGQGLAEVLEAVGGRTDPQSLRGLGPERPGDRRRRHARPEPEPGHLNRVGRPPDRGTEHVGCQVVEATGQRTEEPTPGLAVGAQLIAGPIDVAVHQGGGAVIERVGQVDLRPPPHQSVLGERQRGQERRGHAERMDARAGVVHQARLGELGRPGTTPGCRGSLEDGDAAAGHGEGERGSQAVGP